MFNADQLLSDLVRSGFSDQSAGRLNHAMSQGGLGQIGDRLSQAFGGGQGGLSDLSARAKDLLGQAGSALARGDKFAIGGLGAVVGALLGGGGGAARGALGGAAMAILGTLAYNALKGQSADASAAPAKEDVPLGVRPPETTAEEATLQHRSLLALKAMIAAAKADGQIDPSERDRIMGRLEEAGADQEARDFVAAEMAKPLDLELLVREVPDQQTAAQVYAASLLAIKVDTPAERDYLAQLGKRLGLDAAAVANLHQTLGVPQVA